nr:hypothetical protein [Tanacetum cinerariifolium]
MTKVIKGEFDIIKDVKVKDVFLTCDTPLEVFNNKVSRLSRMDDDLFTYEVEVANIPCYSKMDDDLEYEADDDMGYDPSDVAFTEWLGFKVFNYKTMDHYTMKALWIYWIRRDDEVEFIDEEFSNNEDEIAEVFRIDTNLFELEIPIAYHIGNSLHYQNLKWYDALEDSELKDEALRNKAIVDGLITNDESINDCWKRWRSYEITYHDHNEIEYKNETHNERQELFEALELPVFQYGVFYLMDTTYRSPVQFV